MKTRMVVFTLFLSAVFSASGVERPSSQDVTRTVRQVWCRNLVEPVRFGSIKSRAGMLYRPSMWPPGFW